MSGYYDNGDKKVNHQPPSYPYRGSYTEQFYKDLEDTWDFIGGILAIVIGALIIFGTVIVIGMVGNLILAKLGLVSEW